MSLLHLTVFVPRNNVHDVLTFSYHKEAQGNFLIALGVAVRLRYHVLFKCDQSDCHACMNHSIGSNNAMHFLNFTSNVSNPFYLVS